jgi:signal transduction histidine kinase/HPt (histidine-containing phosphotransfer) domain-containing protein
MDVQLRALFIEDCPDDATLVLRELQRGGFAVTSHRVQTAADLTAALDAQEWDVVISDYSMPQFSGLDALAIVRAKYPDLPFILVSGAIGEATAVTAMKAGANDYLLKDALIRLASAVRRAIQETLAHRAAEDELRRAHAQLEQHIAERTAALAEANTKLLAEIAEKKRIQDELQIAKAAAENANFAKSEFLANMSHEIRTPMTAIMGHADMLMDSALSQSDRLSAIQTIRRQSEHLLTIINDILDLSKIEAGRMEVEPLDCDPCQIAGDVASLMRVNAIERGVRLELQFQGRIPQTIRTDPTRVRQILVNLVGNAIKFTETGGVQIVVSLGQGAAPDESSLRFEVIDSGIGMSAEQIRGLFQPFKQGDSSTTRRFGGTGLGLMIARRLARMLNGDISVQSMPQLGSRFTFSIAIGNLEGVTLRDGRESVRPELPIAESKSTRQLHGHVLLAEDGPANQRVISYYLQKAGLKVTTVDNGRLACDAALAAANAGKPFDVILMDMQMPQLDGYSAAAKLRTSGYTSPIIALTAHAMAHDRKKCIQAGCSDYLSKPIERIKLLDAIAVALGQAGEKAQPVIDAAPPPGTAIQSLLEPNDEVRQFLPMFLAELPEHVQQIAIAVADKDCTRLAEIVHRINGAAGVFGFTNLTDSAARIEQEIEDTKSIEAVAAEIQALADMIRHIEGYAEPVSKTTPRTGVI